MRPLPEILGLTMDAWGGMDIKTFQAAWMVTGYFTSEHFHAADPSPLQSVSDAKKVLDPCEVMDGTALIATPQLCTALEWQIEDGLGCGVCRPLRNTYVISVRQQRLTWHYITTLSVWH